MCVLFSLLYVHVTFRTNLCQRLNKSASKIEIGLEFNGLKPQNFMLPESTGKTQSFGFKSAVRHWIMGAVVWM